MFFVKKKKCTCGMISTLWISVTGKNYFDINQEYEGYIDSEGIQGNFLRQWEYSVSWQGWWLYGGMYLSGLTELHF